MNKDRRNKLGRAIDLINELRDKMEEIKSIVTEGAEAEREYYDNMPDGLKNGDKGSNADNAATQLEEVQNSFEEFDLDELIGKIDDARGSG